MRPHDSNEIYGDILGETAKTMTQGSEQSRTQISRLCCVLKEFPFYARESQLDLVEAALVWSFASLATHPRRKECKVNFYAFVEMMYAASDEAEGNLGRIARQQISADAKAVSNQTAPSIGDILTESASHLRTLSKDHPSRLVAGMLESIRTDYLDHATVFRLQEIIVPCVALCAEIEQSELGIGSDEELANARSNAFQAAISIHKDVIALIDSGKLRVESGKIVRSPSWTDDLDDDDEQDDEEEDD